MKKSVLLPVLSGIALLSVPYVSLAGNVIAGGIFAGVAGSVVSPNFGYKNKSAVDVNKNAHGMLLRPELFAGYGELLSSNNLYFGIAGGVQFGAGKAQEVSYYASAPAVKNSVTQKAVYYVDLMPGILLDNQGGVLYGIFGASDGSFNLSQTGAVPPSTSAPDNFSKTESKFGYRLGVGYNMPLTSNFSVGLKYVYAGFGDVNYTVGTQKYKLSPSNNMLTFGLRYTFGEGDAGNSPFLTN